MAFLRKLQGHVGAPGGDLSDRLPGASAGSPVTAFATTEQQMLRHNVDHPDAMLTAAYPEAAATWMDYPFTVLASANPAERDAAARLLVALQEPNGQAALAAGGFRTPQGQAPADRSADGRTVRDLAAPRPLAESATTDAVLQRWATATRSGRVEVLIDVSGSMNAIVPALGKTRLAVTIDAAARGLNLFEPTTTLGLWTFANRLDGDRDYRQILPVTPVPQLLSGPALETLKSIRAIRGRHTGLYDSVLGLFEEARQNWEPDRLNVVMLLTDGNNDDPAGISREDLLRRLAAESDPARPVRVIGVAVGPDANPTPLQEIAHATGGRSFVVNDPGRIDKVLFAALGAFEQGLRASAALVLWCPRGRPDVGAGQRFAGAGTALPGAVAAGRGALRLSPHWCFGARAGARAWVRAPASRVRALLRGCGLRFAGAVAVVAVR